MIVSARLFSIFNKANCVYMHAIKTNGDWQILTLMPFYENQLLDQIADTTAVLRMRFTFSKR